MIKFVSFSSWTERILYRNIKFPEAVIAKVEPALEEFVSFVDTVANTQVLEAKSRKEPHKLNGWPSKFNVEALVRKENKHKIKSVCFWRQFWQGTKKLDKLKKYRERTKPYWMCGDERVKDPKTKKYVRVPKDCPSVPAGATGMTVTISAHSGSNCNGNTLGDPMEVTITNLVVGMENQFVVVDATTKQYHAVVSAGEQLQYIENVPAKLNVRLDPKEGAFLPGSVCIQRQFYDSQGNILLDSLGKESTFPFYACGDDEGKARECKDVTSNVERIVLTATPYQSSKCKGSQLGESLVLNLALKNPDQGVNVETLPPSEPSDDEEPEAPKIYGLQQQLVLVNSRTNADVTTMLRTQSAIRKRVNLWSRPCVWRKDRAKFQSRRHCRTQCCLTAMAALLLKNQRNWPCQ